MSIVTKRLFALVELGLSLGDILLDGDPAPFSYNGAQPPQFSAHVRCGQTAGWMKTPLRTKIHLGRDNIVLDRDPAPPLQKGRSSLPLFGPSLL